MPTVWSPGIEANGSYELSYVRTLCMAISFVHDAKGSFALAMNLRTPAGFKQSKLCPMAQQTKETQGSEHGALHRNGPHSLDA